jgi:hypothetical protein
VTVPDPPAVDELISFPSHVLRSGVPLVRVHLAERDPRWFGSSGTGRFDPPPSVETFGTCYVSTSPAGAFVEVFGRVRVLRREDIESRCLSQIGTTRDSRLADLTDPRVLGRFGLTGEASAGGIETYPTCQQWAAALFAAGFDGVRYYARHDPQLTSTSVAVFGPPGPDDKLLETLVPPVALSAFDQLDELTDHFGYVIVPTTAL